VPTVARPGEEGQGVLREQGAAYCGGAGSETGSRGEGLQRLPQHVPSLPVPDVFQRRPHVSRLRRRTHDAI